MLLPYSISMLNVGSRELHREMHTSKKRIIDILTQIGSENHKSVELFDALQQIVDLDVRIPIVGILNLGSLSEQGVRFIEEKDCIARFRFNEDPANILLGFTDILADNCRRDLS